MLFRSPLIQTSYRGSQSGAAMTEFIIAAMFVLVPLYLAVQAMGKFADVRHMTQAAARYAAWERTVWFNQTGTQFYQNNRPNQKSDAQIRNEIAVRVFNDRHSENWHYSDQDKSATGFTRGMDPLWEDTAGRAYLTDYANATLAGNLSTPPRDIAGGALDLINAVPSIPYVGGSLAPPVPSQRTLARATFGLRDVARDSDVYQRLWSSEQGLPQDWAGISTHGQAATLTNAWNANSSTGAQAMVSRAVPTAQALGQAVINAGIKTTITAWEPTAGSRLDIGKIDIDAVPSDRLR